MSSMDQAAYNKTYEGENEEAKQGNKDVVAVTFSDSKMQNTDSNGNVKAKPVKRVNVVDDSDLVKNDTREGWGNKIEFVLAIIGYAVGLGNVWRFPYLAQKNGGGAFLIPYVISLILMGIPLFFLELAIGQKHRKGPLHLWDKLYKPLAGLGVASVVASFLVAVYYNMIVAWCFYYLFISFQKHVPYSSCPCVGGPCNKTDPVYLLDCLRASKTTYYYYKVALEATESIDDGGGLNWKLTLCLLLSWIIIFCIICKGVESMGKAVYFTAIFPYIVLFIFFVRALLLDGAAEGIKHMFTPQFDKLGSPEVWLEASTQIFYSLGLSFGGLISMASYNDIHNNFARDALLVSTINCLTSVFAGVVVFGILGYKANHGYEECLLEAEQGLNTTVCDRTVFMNKVASGPGLTFIAFTEAMSTMKATQVWSILFFAMLLTLGIGSMLGTFEAVRTSIVDLQIIPLRIEFVSLILCSISFLFGLLFCQGSGQYWLQMFDTYAANIGLLTLGLFEIIMIMYIYGTPKFEKDIEFMLKGKMSLYWKITLKYVAPVLMIAILIATVYGLCTNGMTYDAFSLVKGEALPRQYPPWAKAVCIILMLSSIIFIPIVALLVRFDKFKLPGVPDEAMFEVRRRSSVLPMHPDQARRESCRRESSRKSRTSKIGLADIPETKIPVVVVSETNDATELDEVEQQGTIDK